MSTGTVVCDICYREVHQDGPNQSWRHCEDKTPMCQGAIPYYPLDKSKIRGKWCGRDDIGFFDGLDVPRKVIYRGKK